MLLSKLMVGYLNKYKGLVGHIFNVKSKLDLIL